MVPRLKACGADMSRITFIDGVIGRENQRETFSLQDDVETARRRLARAHDVEREPFTMPIIDPVTSYLEGGRLKTSIRTVQFKSEAS